MMPLSVDRKGSRWIARSTAFLPNLAIWQEQIAVYCLWVHRQMHEDKEPGLCPSLR
jgi:hypothetical protein